jgi:transcriptional regulator with XRE-family HTH domain
MATLGHLREMRQQRGWTQVQAASRLHVTQAYLSMLERGLRPVPPGMQLAVAQLFALPPTSLPLPPRAQAMSHAELAEAFARLGYPGFRHLAPTAGGRRNPAEVVAAALQVPSLEARLVEALPWLLVEYADLDWLWLTCETKLHDRQNRLGYLLVLARRLAGRTKRTDAARRLRDAERALEPSRLVREDSFAGDALSNAERKWLRRRRPQAARHWHLLTDLTAEQLDHAL